MVNETVGAPITLSTAASWTGSYRTTNPGQVKAHFFGKNIINNILNQPNCVGIRMYHAIDDGGNRTIVLIGVDNVGDDMESGIIADMSTPCPYECGNKNTLSTTAGV